MKVPVFHDDQHGTAIISGAALLNALALVGKPIDEVRVVFSGAGAAAISTAEHYVRLGVRREHITMCDRTGVIYEGRVEDMDPYKARFAVPTELRTIEQALEGADGVRGAARWPGAIRRDWLAGVAPTRWSSRLANPSPRDPCPTRDASVPARRDHRHGRSDYPEPGQQRPGLPVHLPRRARPRATQGERGDEDGRPRARCALLAREDVPRA
jgi:malate dehydrogenase (oxaloacetate-decarboxylating)(NADP+)